jgi:hypothetical protein
MSLDHPNPILMTRRYLAHVLHGCRREVDKDAPECPMPNTNRRIVADSEPKCVSSSNPSTVAEVYAITLETRAQTFLL